MKMDLQKDLILDMVKGITLVTQLHLHIYIDFTKSIIVTT